jgi:hypothetical protein
MKYSTLALLLALALASSAAWAEDKVPKELQDIWCADRVRLSGLKERNCYRFGPNYIDVEGTRADSVFVFKDSRGALRISYNFADVHYLIDVIKRNKDYLILRDGSGVARYNRGNPYAEYCDEK